VWVPVADQRDERVELAVENLVEVSRVDESVGCGVTLAKQLVKPRPFRHLVVEVLQLRQVGQDVLVLVERDEALGEFVHPGERPVDDRTARLQEQLHVPEHRVVHARLALQRSRVDVLTPVPAVADDVPSLVGTVVQQRQDVLIQRMRRR